MSQQVRELPCVGGPLDGEIRTTTQLWLGFPGPWSGFEVLVKDGKSGFYQADPWRDPTRLIWCEFTRKAGDK